MAGARREVIGGRNLCRRFSSRPIPKRGQVKVAIVLGLVHSFSSIFSLSPRAGRRGGGAHFS